MGISNTTFKWLKVFPEQMDDDGISCLPDPLLIDILSLLPIKDAMRTSTLSRRWRNLWKYIHTVKLNIDKKGKSMDLVFWGKIVRYYNKFADNLVVPKLKILQVEFACPHHYQYEVDQLVEFAMVRGVEELALDFSDGWYGSKLYNIPYSTFFSVTLRELKLSNCELQLPASIYLPNLNNISLLSSKLNASTVKILISSCPTLENFSILHCDISGPLIIVDENMVLKTLRIRCKATNFQVNEKVLIDAPRLKLLELGGCMGKNIYSLRNLFSLHKVCLRFYACEDYDVLRKIMLDLHHVKYLKLFLHGTKMYGAKIGLPWQSMNLTCLELVTSLTTRKKLQLIGQLLSSFPQLEILKFVFRDAKDFIIDGQECWDPLQHSFSSRLAQLRTVVIHGFVMSQHISDLRSKGPMIEAYDILKHSENQYELVRILLSNSKNLEKLIIVVSDLLNTHEGSWKTEVLVKLYHRFLRFRRASPAAEIVVC